MHGQTLIFLRSGGVGGRVRRVVDDVVRSGVDGVAGGIACVCKQCIDVCQAGTGAEILKDGKVPGWCWWC